MRRERGRDDAGGEKVKLVDKKSDEERGEEKEKWRREKVNKRGIGAVKKRRRKTEET